MRLFDDISSENTRNGIVPFKRVGSFVLSGGDLSKHVRSILFNGNGKFSYVTYFQSVIPCLEFSMEFQSNQLIYQKEYTKRQQVIYLLIDHLHGRKGYLL